MNIKHQKYLADILLIISIVILSYYFYEEFLVPVNNDYEFDIILKLSNMYDEPLFFIFHWTTADELQVGESSTLWLEIENMPYSVENPPTEEISFQFDERHLNFWNTNTDISESEYYDKLIFTPDWDTNTFKSNKLEFRFIVPTDITADFCDKNIPKCMIFEDIIHPAPFALKQQIETDRNNLSVSYIVLGLTFVVVWSTLRPKA